jgi:hypothetical protein
MSGRGGRGRGRGAVSVARQHTLDLLKRSATEAGLHQGHDMQYRPRLFPDMLWHSSGSSRNHESVEGVGAPAIAATTGSATTTDIAIPKRNAGTVYTINKQRELRKLFEVSMCENQKGGAFVKSYFRLCWQVFNSL